MTNDSQDETNTADLRLVGVTGVTWTDDDGTTYNRVLTDDGIEEIEVTDD